MSEVNFDIYSAMQEGEPVASYKKVCVGKILVKVLNPFSGEVEEIILVGDPFKESDTDSLTIDVWSDKENLFFKKVNKYHFDNGNLQIFDRSAAKRAELANKNYNNLSDDEIAKALERFMSLKHLLDKITSPATLLRILNMARDIGKSEKITKFIEQRLSEVQLETPPAIAKE